ncbi:MAG: hypothetical protein KME06_09405 [Kastovskya adunca ATA6-11-RM4]|jgi:hypothetical protein|nr:hypothetical protein [Kastovskya adunca ATA6-11-RM4]
MTAAAVINVSARSYSLSIGGADCTIALKTAAGGYSHYDQSGLILLNANFTLGPALGFGESLNDRINNRWARGNRIDVFINNSSTLTRAPVLGWLYILSSEYDGISELRIEAGCALSLLNFRTPAGEGACIKLGQATQLDLIASKLLNKAGMPLPYSGGLAGESLNMPLPKLTNESYVSMFGKLCWANGHVGYQSKDGLINVKKASLFPPALLQKNVISHAITYDRLSGAESPCERIVVHGIRKKIKASKDNEFNDSKRYGPAALVDPQASDGGKLILVETHQRQEEINRKGRIKTVTATKKQPLGIVLPEKFPGKYSFINSEQIVEKSFYELPPPGADECNEIDEGKLIKVETEIYRPKGVVLREWLAVQEARTDQKVIVSGLERLVLAEKRVTKYEYNFKKAVEKKPNLSVAVSGAGGWSVIGTGSNQGFMQTEGGESVPALVIDTLIQRPRGFNFPDLADPDANGGLVVMNPLAMQNSERQRQEWRLLRRNPSEWEFTESTSQLYGIAQPDTIELLKEKGVAQIQSLRDSLITIHKQPVVSNSGQTTPPAPERFSPEVAITEEPIIEVVQFPPVAGSGFRDREREYSVDSALVTSAAQLQNIAKIEGAILWGRHKGQSCTIDLDDAIFNASPLARCDWTEPDGSAQAFLMDGLSIALTPTRFAASFDGIWIGRVSASPFYGSSGNVVLPPSTEVLIPPYTLPTVVNLGSGSGFDLRFLPYNTAEIIQASTQLGSGSFFRLLKDWRYLAARDWGNVTANEWGVMYPTPEFLLPKPLDLIGKIQETTGTITCGTCALGTGKVLIFEQWEPLQAYTITVELDPGLGATVGSGVEVQRWSVEPYCPPPPSNNTNPPWTGRHWVTTLPAGGGSFQFAVPADCYGLSIFIRNPNNSDRFDAACLTWNQATKTLTAMSF